MKRTLLLTALTMAMAGGVASADHRHGGWRGGAEWHADAGMNAGNWSGGVVVRSQPVRVVEPRVVVRPHFVQQPAVVVQTVPVQQPQIWIEGRWSWNGSWVWQPGHYEYSSAGYYNEGYDPSYAQGYSQTYDPSYQQGYYNSSYQQTYPYDASYQQPYGHHCNHHDRDDEDDDD
jgi:hypothetical protein